MGPFLDQRTMFLGIRGQETTLLKENFQKGSKSKIKCSMSFERRQKDAITFRDLAFFMLLAEEQEVD